MKILMISYPFPPYGGMSQRNVYFANYLVEQGHHVDVLAANPSKYCHAYDSGLLDLISVKVKVYRTFAGIIHHLRYRILSSLKVNLFHSTYSILMRKIILPLSTLEWLPWGFIYGYWLCKQNKYDVIYSHNNPQITNFLVNSFKKIFGIPYIVYIGDPGFFGAHSQFKSISKLIENKCLCDANRIIVNCEETLNGYLKYFPCLSRKKFIVITDGFDPNRYKSTAPEISKKFRILYTGVFYDSSREPFNLFKAFKNLNHDDIELVIAGEDSNKYKEFLKNNDLEDKIIFLGHQPHNRVIGLQKGASVLLLIGWRGGYQVPGKLFEYLASRKPIMAIRYDYNDVAARFIERYSRGIIVDNNVEEIANVIKSLYSSWKDNQLDSLFNLNEIDEFTWKVLSRKLECVFQAVMPQNKKLANI